MAVAAGVAEAVAVALRAAVGVAVRVADAVAVEIGAGVGFRVAVGITLLRTCADPHNPQICQNAPSKSCVVRRVLTQL